MPLKSFAINFKSSDTTAHHPSVRAANDGGWRTGGQREGRLRDAETGCGKPPGMCLTVDIYK